MLYYFLVRKYFTQKNASNGTYGNDIERCCVVWCGSVLDAWNFRSEIVQKAAMLFPNK